MSFVDFAALKAAVTIEQVAQDFDINAKGKNGQLRAQCPMCMGSDRELVIDTKQGSFFCHNDKKGGDLIAMIAHTEGLRMKEAALEIAKRCGFSSEKPQRQEPNGELQPLAYLVYDHESLPFDDITAQALGVGYAPKGMMRGHIAIPIRLEDGTLAGYLGVPPETGIHKPKKWHGI